MRWDSTPLDINPVFPGIGEIIIIIVIFSSSSSSSSSSSIITISIILGIITYSV